MQDGEFKTDEANLKRLKFNKVLEIAKDMEYILNDSIGEGTCIVVPQEGDEENASSLVCMDVLSFTTFDPLLMSAFKDALGLCDAVNFFNADGYVRITFGFKDTHSLKTEIREFKK